MSFPNLLHLICVIVAFELLYFCSQTAQGAVLLGNNSSPPVLCIGQALLKSTTLQLRAFELDKARKIMNISVPEEAHQSIKRMRVDPGAIIDLYREIVKRKVCCASGFELGCP